MTNNFKCKNCSFEFFVAQYSIKIINNETIYNYKTTGKRIECSKCHYNNIKSIDKPGDFKTLELGKYSMQSISQRQESLKQRSHNHFKREIKEKQHEINKSATLGTLG
jgi:hypothetical protein